MTGDQQRTTSLAKLGHIAPQKYHVPCKSLEFALVCASFALIYILVIEKKTLVSLKENKPAINSKEKNVTPFDSLTPPTF